MVKKMIAVVALSLIAVAAHASVDPLAQIEQKLETQPPAIALLEELVAYDPLTEEVSDLVIEMFFPDMWLLRNAQVSEYDLERELCNR